MTGYGQIWIGLHSLIIYCWIFIGTFIFGLLAILASFFSRNGNSVHHIARLWGRSILWVSGIRTVTSGFSPDMRHCSYIYMSNHQSNFDIPVLYSALPVQFRWLAKAELFKIPIFGQGMRGAGYISIDRSNRQSAFRSLAEAADAIRNGTSVMIFPEGTRSPNGRLRPFKTGGILIAVRTGCPIIPVAISGSHEVLPKGSLRLHPGRIKVTIALPIQTVGIKGPIPKDIVTKKVWESISTMLNEENHPKPN